MPKRKPSRSQRRGRRPLMPAPPPPPPLVTAAATVSAPEEVPAAAAPAITPARERSVSRFSARDYSYVRRELQRIVLLAAAIFIAIVILSFFLP